MIDYPGRIASVIYTQGCNFRCPFCHNPELVCPELFQGEFLEEDIFSFLEKRVKELDGVVVTGGEPLMHSDSFDFISRIKELGYSIKLDTNGCYPQRLEQILRAGIVDFAAMDIKAPLHKYDALTGVHSNHNDIEYSIELIKKYACEYEFRTTVVKNMLTKNDLLDIINMIEPAKKYVVQRFRSDSQILDESLRSNVYTDAEFHEKKLYLDSYGFETQVYFR